MGRLRHSESVESGSGFTSMIDIVFLLLIFFILQPFKETELRLEASLPEQPPVIGPDEPPLLKEISVDVRIRSVLSDPTNAQYIVDGRLVGRSDQVDSARLSAWLQRQSCKDPNVPVRIQPDRDIRFDHVAKVLDACYGAGMGKIQFAAAPLPVR